MIGLLALLLVPLHFTAPADTVGVDAAGRARLSNVGAYVFRRLDGNDTLPEIPGFADSTGSTLLRPHAPGTRETVWLPPGPSGDIVTVFAFSLDAGGNRSQPGNGWIIGGAPTPSVTRAAPTELDVPLVRQARERCGQAALTMVLRYYGAAPRAMSAVDAAYDPALRGVLITDLASAARRAGYRATVATLTPDSLIDLLHAGVPPILLYQNGTGPFSVRHFGVVTGWDAASASFRLNDGGTRARVARRQDLAHRWEQAGSQALIVRRLEP